MKCCEVASERCNQHVSALPQGRQQHCDKHQSRAGSMAQDVELESLLYAIGMESNTGYRHMEMLCDLLAVPFPPKNKPKEKNETDSKRFCKGEAGVWASVETELKPTPQE